MFRQNKGADGVGGGGAICGNVFEEALSWTQEWTGAVTGDLRLLLRKWRVSFEQADKHIQLWGKSALSQ